MEDELTAQRDAAIAVTKELQKQLQSRREEMERTFERRTLNAERLRLHAEERLRRAVEEREWAVAVCNRLLLLSLFCGMLGAIAGWASGLLVFTVVGQPFVGFLLVLPGMAAGTLLGLAIAKTKVELESRRRDVRKQNAERHSEVEMAVSSVIGVDGAPLEPLEGVPGMEGVDAAAASVQDPSAERQAGATPSVSGSGSSATLLVGMGWNAAWYTLQTTASVASGLYHSKEYVQGIFQTPETKKQQ